MVVSSIWQELARQEKFAYVTTKAAIAGLVPSVAIDLGSMGFAINAVLPGVIASPMAKTQLSEAEISRIKLGTPGGKLASEGELANVIEWLASSRSIGINAESIRVDNGWSRTRHV